MEAQMDGQMVRYGEGEVHSGYLALPKGGVGPGVLVLHAWWGLNDFFKSVCDRLAAEGYVALAPDFYGGKVVDTADEATRLSEAADRAVMQEGILEAAVRFLVRQPGIRPIGIGVIGFSMGAAYALALAGLRPNTVRAVVLFYGTYIPDFSAATAAFLGHFAEHDEWEPAAGVAALQAALMEAGRPVTFYFYTGTGHWFFEANRPDTYRPEAAQLAWQRTLAFLAEQLGEKDEPLPRSTAELMARVEQGWSEIQQAVAGRRPEELERPGPDGWSVREHLAHVAFWERLMLLSYIGGKPSTEVAGMDEATLESVDGVNAIVAGRSRSRSLEEVLSESEQVHAAVVAELAGRPFETWMRPRFPDDPDERPLLLWVAGNTYGHYGEHAGYIRRLLAG
jgi:carboxymethylenebutenolidase